VSPLEYFVQKDATAGLSEAVPKFDILDGG
jgi:hypothetical protein